MVSEEFEFDFVISYASEHENHAENLKQALHEARVFFSPDYQAQVWGKNLYEYLSEVYSKKGRYCIPLISQHYVKKLWTRHEWQSAQERALQEINSKEYILPIRLDDTEVPGLLSTIVYQDARKKTLDVIAELALEKLRAGHPASHRSGPDNLKESIKYGDTIKLRHAVTHYWLCVHDIPYSHYGTSGQRQITASPNSGANDDWRVKGPQGQPMPKTQPVRHGDVIRLENLATGLNLHSHPNHPSPLTAQQEVTGAGHHELSDSNDNWRIELEGGEIWCIDTHFMLIHANTNCTLHSHEKRHDNGEQEVTCYGNIPHANDWWYVSPYRKVSQQKTKPIEISEKYLLTPDAKQWARNLVQFWNNNKIEQSFRITEALMQMNQREMVYGHGILDDVVRKDENKPSPAVLRELASNNLIEMTLIASAPAQQTWEITLMERLKQAVASEFSK
jgi:TIR domain/MIR domain